MPCHTWSEMVGRAFVEALKFGAPGGALVAWVPVWISPAQPNEVNVMTESLGAVLLSTIVGAVIGFLFAYPSLIAGSIAAELVRPWVGAVAALLVTVAGLELWFAWLSVWDWSSPWTAFPVGIAAYAAVVAWFRIPRILGR